MSKNTGKLKVLLVDGSSMFLNLYSCFLANLGCEVFTAVDFKAATDQLRLLEDHDIKVVFVDDRHFGGGSEIDAVLIDAIHAGWPNKEIVAITTDERVVAFQKMGKVDAVIFRGPETSNMAGFREALVALRFLGP